jgi:hypothetical protein
MACLMASLIRYAFSSTSVHAFDERAMPPVDAPFWARPFEPWPISDHEIRDTSERRVELWNASPPALPPPPPPPSPPLPQQPSQPPSLPSLSNGRI